MSRPRGSVPRRYEALGAARTCRGSYRSGSCGVMAPPRGSCAEPLTRTDSGIHEPIRDFDEEVGEEDPDRHDDDHALHDREVTAEDGVNEEHADAREREDRLRDDGAPEETRDADAEDAEDRQQRVPEGVCPEDPPLPKALGPGGSHVVALERVEHLGPGEPREV